MTTNQIYHTHSVPRVMSVETIHHISNETTYGWSIYHRVVSPGKYGEAVLVLTKLLFDLWPHALILTIQQDEDGLLTQLQQVQEALSKKYTEHQLKIGHCTLEQFCPQVVRCNNTQIITFAFTLSKLVCLLYKYNIIFIYKAKFK